MRRLTNAQKKRYGIIAGVILPWVIIVFILGLPFYFTFVIYLAAFLVTLVLYFPNYLAVWANFNYMRGKESARSLLFAAINRNSKSPAAHLNYAILLVREGDGQNALDALNKALALNPNVITEKNIRLTIGSCYWVMKDIDKAIETLEDMRKRYDYVNAHVLTSLSYMYFLKGEINTALDLTNKAIEDSPDYAAAYDNLGQIHYKLGELEDAKQAFMTALTHKSNLPDSNYYMGLIYEHENDSKKAAGYFDKAYQCKLSALNTVTKEQIEEKYIKYKDE